MLLTGITVPGIEGQCRPDVPNRDSLKNLLFRIADRQLDQMTYVGEKEALDWQPSVFYISLTGLDDATGQARYLDRLRELGNRYDWMTVSRMYDADFLAIGQVYLAVFTTDRDTSEIRHLRWMLDSHLRCLTVTGWEMPNPPASNRKIIRPTNRTNTEPALLSWPDHNCTGCWAIQTRIRINPKNPEAMISLLLWSMFCLSFPPSASPPRAEMNHRDEDFRKGKLIIDNPLASHNDVKSWVMEGPGKLEFHDGWMEMYSGLPIWDHVFWCPTDIPGSFVAEWEARNMQPDSGLLIIFFAATGDSGQDIFSPGMPRRDGTFKYYNRGRIDCYHISYYANNPKNPGRDNSHLRKDPMFALLQTGPAGIPRHSVSAHRMRLIKDHGHIIMYVDRRKIIDYTDDGKTNGPVYSSGKIGFRQMRWSHFRYRNFKVWELRDDQGKHDK